ncbi:hypothetical protein BCR44DRAFT_34257 [Catenaria anguillulae PL171]|uniref:Uncharacterized protein n=1 Tax=Catenaria anguillulae PL171 TaxID=765915 RepID=A0A1Y2HQ90_9FUNG|nr:hypothetical protein BCR44DRAFT_34257 [Catenaria anguillulae PL171]
MRSNIKAQAPHLLLRICLGGHFPISNLLLVVALVTGPAILSKVSSTHHTPGTVRCRAP